MEKRKRSITKQIRNCLESLRDSKVNEKLETLKKTGFLARGRGVKLMIGCVVDPIRYSSDIDVLERFTHVTDGR